MSGIDSAGRARGSIAVIGGGRWARVLTDVLCRLTPSGTRVAVHSPGNAAAMNEWAARSGWGERIVASSEWPSLDPSSVVLVVNAARNHAQVAERALAAGASVLIEKPMALTAQAAHRLVAVAQMHGARLATAHIFMFASYLERFVARVAEAGGAQAMRVTWIDPGAESRYGEEKRFDPGLPVYADWLPHVLSVASMFVTDASQSCEGLTFSRGGALLELRLRLRDTPLEVRLARNSDRRVRLLEIDTPRGPMSLDFATEPGVVRLASGEIADGDPQWSTGARPSARMLGAFLAWAGGGPPDARLDAAIGVRACEVIDAVAVRYAEARAPWLAQRLAHSDTSDDDLRYALSEMAQADGPLPAAEIEARLARLKQEICLKPEVRT
jgi:predicted dehydrogenase